MCPAQQSSAQPETERGGSSFLSMLYWTGKHDQKSHLPTKQKPFWVNLRHTSPSEVTHVIGDLYRSKAVDKRDDSLT